MGEAAVLGEAEAKSRGQCRRTRAARLRRRLLQRDEQLRKLLRDSWLIVRAAEQGRRAECLGERRVDLRSQPSGYIST